MTGHPRLLSMRSSLRSSTMRPGEYAVDDAGCWIWQRYIDPTGYGFNGRVGQTQRAHRYVYEELVGPIPEGFHLHHRCGVRACVNPDHLEPMEPSEHLKHHQHEASALTIEQVREIRTLDLSHAELAERFGTTVGAIQNIRSFNCWKDAGGPERPEVYCQECGDLITTGHRQKRYCSKECQSRWNSRLQWHRKQGKVAPPLRSDDSLVRVVEATAGDDGWATSQGVARELGVAPSLAGRLLMRLVAAGSLESGPPIATLAPRRYRVVAQERNAA